MKILIITIWSLSLSALSGAAQSIISSQLAQLQKQRSEAQNRIDIVYRQQLEQLLKKAESDRDERARTEIISEFQKLGDNRFTPWWAGKWEIKWEGQDIPTYLDIPIEVGKCKAAMASIDLDKPTLPKTAFSVNPKGELEILYDGWKTLTLSEKHAEMDFKTHIMKSKKVTKFN